MANRYPYTKTDEEARTHFVAELKVVQVNHAGDKRETYDTLHVVTRANTQAEALQGAEDHLLVALRAVKDQG